MISCLRSVVESEGEERSGDLGAEARVLMDAVTGQHIHMQVPGSYLCSSLAPEGKVGGKSFSMLYRSYRVTPSTASLLQLLLNVT